MMKVLQVKLNEDYGHDLYITLLQIKDWSLIQSCFSTMVYGRSWPYFSFIMGSGRLLSTSFQIWNVGFTIELISRSWFKKRFEE